MIGYMDRTWCPLSINSRCSRSQGCYRAFTSEDQKDAEKWWGNPDFPIVQYTQEPDCFVAHSSDNQKQKSDGSS